MCGDELEANPMLLGPQLCERCRFRSAPLRSIRDPPPKAIKPEKAKSSETGDWTDDYPGMFPKQPLNELYPGLHPKEKK